MANFAYFARTNAGTGTNVPADWPYGWQYPADGNSTPYPTSPISGGNIVGIPWPPAWPPVVVAGTDIVVSAPATVSLASPSATIEAEIQINASNTGTSVYLNHLLQVTCAEGGVERFLGKTNGNYAQAIYYKVSNYAGSKYGFSQTIYFDPSNWAALDLIDITVKLVTVTANPDGTDQWEVVT